MTRDEVLGQARLVQESVTRLINLAMEAIRPEDFMRIVDEVAPWAEIDQLSDDAIAMVSDLALFEPDDSGERWFDRFFAEQGGGLPSEDRALAAQICQSQFSIFRVAETHQVAGLWLESILDHDRRFWVVDSEWGEQATQGAIVGMRLFEPGPFHAGLGVVIEPDDQSLGSCLAAWARRGPLPDQQSLAAQIYSDNLVHDDVEGNANAEANLALIRGFAKALVESAPELVDRTLPIPQKKPSKRAKRRKR